MIEQVIDLYKSKSCLVWHGLMNHTCDAQAWRPIISPTPPEGEWSLSSVSTLMYTLAKGQIWARSTEYKVKVTHLRILPAGANIVQRTY